MTAQDAARLEILRAAKPNSWIAFNEDETQVVGEGKTMKKAWEQAKRNGFDDPIVWRIPRDWRPRVLCPA
jgi:hypothetical protein